MPFAGIGPPAYISWCSTVRDGDPPPSPPKGVAALLARDPYYADAYPLRQFCSSDTISIFTPSNYYALQVVVNWEL